MRFQVPQFTEIEDKIFGPLTLKQFIYLAGGGGLSFMIYIRINNLLLSVIPIFVVIGISITFAFYKINNKPFVSVVESAYNYYRRNKLYIWQKQDKVKPENIQNAVKDAEKYASVMVPKISESKLKDLTWSLNIKESIYSDKNQN